MPIGKLRETKVAIATADLIGELGEKLAAERTGAEIGMEQVATNVPEGRSFSGSVRVGVEPVRKLRIETKSDRGRVTKHEKGPW